MTGTSAGAGPPDRRRSTPAPGQARNDERRALSRAAVMNAALELVDAEGLGASTMRRLGQRVGRDPMTLYRHTAGRDDLLDGVAELVLGALVIPDDDGRGWQQQLRTTAVGFRALALAHPHVVPLLATRPLATPLGLRPLGTLRPLERVLAILVDAGFPPATALHAYRGYFGLLYGHVLNELQEYVVDPEESDDLLRLGLHRLPPREFPHVRSLAGELGRYDGAAELQLGLDYLLAGLAGRLPARPV